MITFPVLLQKKHVQRCCLQCLLSPPPHHRPHPHFISHEPSLSTHIISIHNPSSASRRKSVFPLSLFPLICMGTCINALSLQMRFLSYPTKTSNNNHLLRLNMNWRISHKQPRYTKTCLCRACAPGIMFQTFDMRNARLEQMPYLSTLPLVPRYWPRTTRSYRPSTTTRVIFPISDWHESFPEML